MLIFSPTARQLIDEAVAELPSEALRAIWTSWTREHPAVRQIGTWADDGRGPFPREVLNIVFAALEGMSARLRLQRAEPTVSEDEIADLENDLSRIRSVERALYENIQLNQPPPVRAA